MPTPSLLTSLLLLPSTLTTALPQSGPVAPADLVPLNPATPNYKLNCPQLPPGTSSGDPQACRSLLLEHLTTLGPQVKFTNSIDQPRTLDTIPLSLSSTKFPTYDNNGKTLNDNCTVTFDFVDDNGDELKEYHDETWTPSQLRKYAVLAWGKCMVQPDGGVVSPGTYASIVPMPGSKTMNRLRIEVKSVGKVEEVATA